MFTVYIDDSGTAPDQKVVVAAAMIVPAAKIASLNQDWADFDRGYGFSGDFHSSVCVARNPKSVFIDWNDRKVRNAFRRACSIIKRHASICVSFTVYKEDFIAEAPKEWLELGGYDMFTWALRTLLNVLRAWPIREGLPYEYVFDWVEPRARAETEMMMAQFESAFPGEYESRYSFRKRQLVPALQCADLLAWQAFSLSRLAFQGTPMHNLATASFRDLKRHLNGELYHDLTFTREELRNTIALDGTDIASQERRRDWYANWTASKQQKKK